MLDKECRHTFPHVSRCPSVWRQGVVEVIVGVLLILGLFTGIAALVGLLLNVSFLFAGNAGVNPFFALTAGALIAAWRVAGYFGLDYWVLPLVGVPFSGHLEKGNTAIRDV